MGRRFASLRCLPPSKDARRKRGKSAREDWRIAVERWRAEPKRVESRRLPEADDFREAFALRAAAVSVKSIILYWNWETAVKSLENFA